MTRPTKREQLAAMRLEDFKQHLRAIAGGSPEEEVTGKRANPLLVRNRKEAALKRSDAKTNEGNQACVCLLRFR
jgi:hypothetical protein